MSSLKLIYFNSKGRAETTRLLLALAGAEYEDYRLEDGEWPKVKPTTPLGQVPVLVIDGEVMISQSHAVERYLARRFGFVGKTDVDQAHVDMIVDTVEDIFSSLVLIYVEKNDARKAELLKKTQTDTLPGILDNLEKLLKANKGGDGFIVGDSITLADVALANILNALTTTYKLNVDFESRPKLKALIPRVLNQPKIADWIEKRPKTNF